VGKSRDSESPDRFKPRTTRRITIRQHWDPDQIDRSFCASVFGPEHARLAKLFETFKVWAALGTRASARRIHVREQGACLYVGVRRLVANIAREPYAITRLVWETSIYRMARKREDVAAYKISLNPLIVRAAQDGLPPPCTGALLDVQDLFLVRSTQDA